MAEMQVRALYDFESGGGGELSFTADEILSITNPNIGDGWVEAQNSRGQVGLIPEAYTEIYVPEPKMPPPPPPAFMMGGGPKSPTSPKGPPQMPLPPLPSPQMPPPQMAPPPQSWSQPAAPPVNNGLGDPGQGQRQDSYDDWDEDWDDDDNSSTTTETQDVTGSQYLSGNSTKGPGKYGTVGKKFGTRFSAFSKSGGDAYLFGTVTVPMPDTEKIQIIDTPDGPKWKPVNQPYNCALASPKKESKFHGMKSFIAYQLTPSFSNIQVSRRYKHFDWLHERLAEKFTTIVVPPLPDKQISGRYEEDFISERMRQLQKWIDRMCAHPVICHSDVFHHFMSCTDEKRWKAGKRRAEKDEFQGGKFFLSLKTPGGQLDQKDVENRVERFSRFVKSMDDSVRHFCSIGDSNMKKHNGPFRKEFQKLGNSFISLARSFEFDERPGAQNLTKAVEHTGTTYNEIGVLFSNQPRYDMIGLLQGLEEYKGLLSVFPDILSVHRGASQKMEESYTKLSEADLQTAQSRIDTISYASLAEMNHFNEGRVPDFKAYMQHYLTNQIDFYQQITKKLQDALQKYNDA